MYDELAAWLPNCGADVLCLQEVTRTAGLGGWTHFEDGERSMSQRANLFDDVLAAMPRHQGNFVANDAGPVTDPDGRLHQEDFGLAMFIDEHMPVIGQHTSFVYGDFVDQTRWAIADRPRLAQSARVLDRATGRAVTIIHLHGIRDPAGKADTPARLTQAKALADLVTTIRVNDELLVLAGDLNLLPDSETFSILAEVGLTDLVGEADTRTSRYKKPVRHANYLLVSDPDAVKGFWTPAQPEVSDHRALILDL